MSRMIQSHVIQQKSQPSLFQKLAGKAVDFGLSFIPGIGGAAKGAGIGDTIMGGGGGGDSSVIQGASNDWNQAKLGDTLMADQQKNILTPEKNMFALPSDTGQPNSAGGSSQGYGGGSGSTQGGAEAPGAPYGASELADQSDASTEAMIAELEKDQNNAGLVAYLRSNPQYAQALLKSRGGH